MYATHHLKKRGENIVHSHLCYGLICCHMMITNDEGDIYLSDKFDKIDDVIRVLQLSNTFLELDGKCHEVKGIPRT